MYIFIYNKINSNACIDSYIYIHIVNYYTHTMSYIHIFIYYSYTLLYLHICYAVYRIICLI